MNSLSPGRTLKRFGIWFLKNVKDGDGTYTNVGVKKYNMSFFQGGLKVAEQ